jgi:hypothetical protein
MKIMSVKERSPLVPFLFFRFVCLLFFHATEKRTIWFSSNNGSDEVVETRKWHNPDGSIEHLRHFFELFYSSVYSRLFVQKKKKQKETFWLTKFVFSATSLFGPLLLTVPAENNPGKVSRRVRPKENFAKMPKISPKNAMSSA